MSMSKEESKIETELFDEADNIVVLPIKKGDGIREFAEDEGIKPKEGCRKIEKEVKAKVRTL